MSEFALSVVQNLPAVIMLVIGFVLVVVEMYIPGFGAPGIIGILLLVLGVIATNPSPLQALVLALIIVVLLCIAFSICIRTVSRGKLSKTPLVLNDVSTGSYNIREYDQDVDGYFWSLGGVGDNHCVDLLKQDSISEISTCYIRSRQGHMKTVFSEFSLIMSLTEALRALHR